METCMDLISVGPEFVDRSSYFNTSLSFISVQSLSSARGSTPIIKRRRYYDATQPMDNVYEAPIHRLKCLRGLHECGLLQIGDKETDTRTRRALDEYLRNSSRASSSTIRPRKEFPSLRTKARTFSCFKSKQLEQYFKNEQINKRKTLSGGKSVTFALPGKSPNSESIKKATVTVLQQNKDKDITTRPYAEKLLLRRPTTKPTQNKVDEEMFITIATSLKLKPFNFKTSNDQHAFYTQNFPLLLDAHSDEKALMAKRIPTPEMVDSPEVKRQLKLNTRLTELESSLNTLDKETEDVDFKTILRDEVFYPNKWPWNEKKSSDHQIAPSPIDY